MLTRILTAAVGIVVFLAAIFSPTPVFTLAICAVTAVMLAEMYKVLSCGAAVNTTGFISAAVIAAFNAFGKNGSMTPAIAAAVMIYLVTAVLLHTKLNAKDIMSHGFATLFITIFMMYIPRLHVYTGALGTMWIFVIAWLTDTGAYFAGVFLGRHKLVPHISPKKTVGGAIGGLAAATIACAVYYFIITAAEGAESSLSQCLYYAAIGLIGSALAQIGDFAASCIKRDYNVKDYGNVLPGHGGFMDRFDSVVFIAPFVYYAVVYMFV